jgi:RNA polymerase sigma factor (sigma-70 family)
MTAQGKEKVQKALLYQRVRGAIMNYHRRWTNGGIGGRDAPVFEHVYLADTIPGTSDDDGDPVTYEDVTCYEDPPGGYDGPENELETLRAKQRVQKLLPLLSREDRELIHFLYFSDKTQQEVAAIYNVTQQSVQERTQRVLKKLRLLAL